MSLSAQPDRLPLLDARRARCVERPPGRQGDPDRAAARDRGQRNGDGDRDVLAFRGLLRPGPAAPASPPNNSDRMSWSIDPARRTPRPVPKSKPRKSPAPAPGWRPNPPKPSNCGARGLPSASISPRSNARALLLVAENLVRRSDLGEAFLGARLLALVGVIFLGELAERGLDFRRAGRLRHPENVIRITHHEPILSRPPSSKHGRRCLPRPIWALDRPARKDWPRRRRSAVDSASFPEPRAVVDPGRAD